jgi:hypothetical protein
LVAAELLVVEAVTGVMVLTHHLVLYLFAVAAVVAQDKILERLSQV